MIEGIQFRWWRNLSVHIPLTSNLQTVLLPLFFLFLLCHPMSQGLGLQVLKSSNLYCNRANDRHINSPPANQFTQHLQFSLSPVSMHPPQWTPPRPMINISTGAPHFQIARRSVTCVSPIPLDYIPDKQNWRMIPGLSPHRGADKASDLDAVK